MNRQRTGKNIRKILTTKDINPLGRERQNVPASDSPKESVSNPPPPLPVQQAPVPKKRNPEPVRLPSPWGKPFVVVLVNWNCDKWLSDLFESLGMQTADTKQWGVLLLDNNSDDSSLGKCRRYGVTHIRLPENIGKLDGLNFVSATLDDSVVILEVDCDDTLEPNAVDVIISAWKDVPDAALIYTQYVCVNENLSFRTKGHCKQVGTGIVDAGNISHLKTYLAGSLKEVGGLDGSVRKSTDKELIYRLQELSERTGRRIVFVDEPVYRYRRRVKGSITRMRHWDATKARRQAYKRRSGMSNDAVCVFSATPTSDSGGPGIFWSRILAGLAEKEGFLITDDYENADVVFGNIKIGSEPDHQRPWVVRLDGVYFNTKSDYKRGNEVITDVIQASEGVVYQSEWGKAMADEYCGTCPGETVIIPNAVSIPIGWKKAPKKDRKTILACSRWGDVRYKRKFKRLEETLLSFRESQLASEGYELVILGQHYLDETKYRFDGVKFLGRIPSVDVWNYLSNAAAFMHLSWVDCCPNSVIEASTAHVPTLYCADGSAEIVGDGGTRILDSELNHPCDINKPPRLNRQEIADSLIEMVNTSWPSDKFNGFSMEDCVDRYADFLRSVVRKGVDKKDE